MQEYNEKAIQFLNDTGTSFSIEKAVPQKKPNWAKEGEKYGINYIVTLKNKNGSYTFDYWNSISKAELLEHALYCKEQRSTNNKKGDVLIKLFKENKITTNPYIMTPNRIIETVETLITPTPYDVLACIDVMYNDTFEDFCFNYGYDDDSITAKRIYDASMLQDRMLRKMFTQEQLEQLQDIN